MDKENVQKQNFNKPTYNYYYHKSGRINLISCEKQKHHNFDSLLRMLFE